MNKDNDLPTINNWRVKSVKGTRGYVVASGITYRGEVVNTGLVLRDTIRPGAIVKSDEGHKYILGSKA